MNLDLLLTFAFVSISLAFSPGPDILFVISQSIANGKKVAISISAGLVTGVIVHTTLAILGISALIKTSDIAFSLLKFAGAIYLCYLGFMAIKHSKLDIILDKKSKETSCKSFFIKGLFMNILNPKVTLFFLTFLPQFIPEGSKNPSINMLVLGLVFMICAFCVFVFVSVVADKIFYTLRKKPLIAQLLNILSGIIFFGIALYLLCSNM